MGMRKLPANITDQFRTAFEEICDDHDHWQIKKLAGREGSRLRIGGYRGIYKIEGEQVTVLVLDVGRRGGIYK
jgi:mRNA interferase RelE/StbE